MECLRQWKSPKWRKAALDYFLASCCFSACLLMVTLVFVLSLMLTCYSNIFQGQTGKLEEIIPISKNLFKNDPTKISLITKTRWPINLWIPESFFIFYETAYFLSVNIWVYFSWYFQTALKKGWYGECNGGLTGHPCLLQPEPQHVARWKYWEV